MNREEEVKQFKKDLADFRFHQEMCFECKMLEQQHKDHVGGFEKLCRVHLNALSRLSGFWPMEN